MTQIEFWQQRWLDQQTGFHEGQVNEYLEKYWPSLNVGKEKSVFLPLSGKSQDLIWLSKNCSDVIGVECSEIAVAAFFDENNLHPETHQLESETKKSFSVWRADNITIYCGDIFELDAAWFVAVECVFDRAALVALDASVRQKYQQKISQLCPTANILLVAFEYPQQQMAGPPFSVSEMAVNALYDSRYSVARLESNDILKLPENDKFKQRGLTSLFEKVFLLKLK